jgi:hypothetical protein
MTELILGTVSVAGVVRLLTGHHPAFLHQAALSVLAFSPVCPPTPAFFPVCLPAPAFCALFLPPANFFFEFSFEVRVSPLQEIVNGLQFFDLFL